MRRSVVTAQLESHSRAEPSVPIVRKIEGLNIGEDDCADQGHVCLAISQYAASDHLWCEHYQGCNLSAEVRSRPQSTNVHCREFQ